MPKELAKDYYKKLDHLFENQKLNKITLNHFKKRGIQIYDTFKDLGGYHLSKLIPYVVVGASNEFVEKMNIPYQATSFIASQVFSQDSGIYAYKLSGVKGGGVQFLTGGSRKMGDNIFASLHRILIGNQAIIVTINNMMENHDQIWSWDFFGKHLIGYPLIYDDLLHISKKYIDRSKFYFIISIRSIESIVRSNVIECYRNNKIAMLNPVNNIKVIIFTSSQIYEYISKYIKESDLISYIITGERFDNQTGLQILRKKYGVRYLLNDGGRRMSNSMRDDMLLGEERITLEPFNPMTLNYKIDDDCILGKRGTGLDDSEVESSILLNSLPINYEKANVYLYPLDERKIFR